MDKSYSASIAFLIQTEQGERDLWREEEIVAITEQELKEQLLLNLPESAFKTVNEGSICYETPYLKWLEDFDCVDIPDDDYSYYKTAKLIIFVEFEKFYREQYLPSFISQA